MYNGIGLTTPRGSGTNGYVQRNVAYIREKPKIQYSHQIARQAPPVSRTPNQEILEHERKRQIELKVTKWGLKTGIYDKGLSEEELEKALAEKRQEFTVEGKISNFFQSHLVEI